MQKLNLYCTAIILMAVSSFCLAQAEIVESQPIGGSDIRNTQSSNTSASPQVTVDNRAQSEFYYQLQMLQQEVQQLRGTVDEQTHEIRQLKQRQLDDYVDLDRRLSQLSKANGGVAGLSGTKPTVSTATAVTSATGANTTAEVSIPADDSAKNEFAAYDKAVRLIIKDKELDAGAAAMNAYLERYPTGIYVGNAQYWLGQIAFVGDDLDGAKKWFGKVLVTDPSSQKAPEAKYKLGLVLHRLGDATEAQNLLLDVASTSSAAARLAQEYLRSNF